MLDTLSLPLAILVAVLDLVAVVQVWRSRIEFGRKVVWSLVIVLLPVVGLLMWAVAAGPWGKARL
ncbi:PLDc N-terminal domain-containing protein [Pseudomonas oligotrophica]|uniref:PLDc N-terminal domain-containing protein n=1 Tax=Pseudomonas oligotrophica TaxID=2912055 RepID=UPI001F3B0F95|nr:PLDc N-terminal domain-containing protein [Pseudomonas oligotrophica]MCF7203390.1 PLDc N-terminal domain-containing protein [Pseudomonas oligotrophica]